MVDAPFTPAWRRARQVSEFRIVADDISLLAILAATQNHFTMSLMMRSGLSGPSGI